MRFGSLFSGIGGIDLGLERAGMECAWQVEMDPFCNRVLAKHWPSVPRFPDVREVGHRELERVDVIAGGFPCQDLSAAGRQKGLGAERSGLWFEFRRIIAALLPDWAILENVYQTWRKWVPFVRRELWGLGYASLPIRLRAVDFGALHLRARCFVIAHADGDRLRPERWRCSLGPGKTRSRDNGAARALADTASEREREQADEADAISDRRTARAIAGGRGEPVADADGLGRDGWLLSAGQAASESAGLQDIEGGHPWASEPDVGRVAHGVPNRAHRLRGLGNAVVPQKAEWIGRRIIEMSSEADVSRSEEP